MNIPDRPIPRWVIEEPSDYDESDYEYDQFESEYQEEKDNRW